jgi:hypothetical protein
VTAALFLVVTACGGEAASPPDSTSPTGAGPATTLVPGPDIPLRYVYQEGASFVHEASSDDTITIDAALVGGAEGSVTSTEVSKERRTAVIQQVQAGGAALQTITYETLESSVDGVAEDVSAEPARESTVTVDGTGRVTSVEGFDEDDATSGSFDSTGFSALFAYLDAAYDSTVVHYPEDGVAKVGEEWSSDYTIPLPGMDKDLTVTTHARLVSVSTVNGRQLAVIEHTSTMPVEVTLDLSAFYQAQLEGSSFVGDLDSVVVKMTMAGTVDYAATSTVDLATGQIVSSEGRAAMAVEFTYTEAPEQVIPLDHRGPFAMDASGTRIITEVR